MPFSEAEKPSLGLSLLKAGLTANKVFCRIFYLNIRFAEEVGHKYYQDFIRCSRTNLAEEWIFSEAFWGPNRHRDNSYFKQAIKQEEEALKTRRPRLDISDFGEKIHFFRQKVDNFLDRCLNTIPWQQFQIVGFHSQFKQQMSSLALAKRLKARYPKVIIVFGGANCIAEMGSVLMRCFPFIDAVCTGEGDIVFPEFVRKVLSGGPIHSVPGMLHRLGRGGLTVQNAQPLQDMDCLPYPDFDDFFDQWLQSSSFRPEEICLVLDTSRGCWWGEKSHCTFCGQERDLICFRQKTARRAFREISWLAKKYGRWARNLGFADNILPPDYSRTLLPRLRSLKRHFHFFYETRVNLTKNDMRALQQSGVRNIQAGLESLSTTLLQRMRKGTTALQNIQFLKWCLQFGIYPEWNFLFGVPGERPEDYDKMPDLFMCLSHLQPPFALTPVCFPRFSPYQQSPKEFGIRRLKPSPFYRFIYPGFKDKTISDLAYYFIDGFPRDKAVTKSTAKLLPALDGWLEEHHRSSLFSIEEKNRFLICDFRQGFKRRIYSLVGLRRRVYKACDRIQSRTNLLMMASRTSKSKSAENSVGEALEFFIKNRLMVEENQKYLSLAVPLGYEYFPPAPIWPYLPKVLNALERL